MALNTSGVTHTIALDNLNLLTGYSILLVFFTKLGFIVFMVRFFFLLNHFLAVEDYELSKSTRHSPWNTKEFYLDQSFFSDTIVSLMMLCVR